MQTGNKTKMGRLLMAALISTMFFTTGLAAAVTATVDRNTITEFDLLTLTVRVTGGEPDTAPDFSGISRDFDIISTQNQQSSSINFINGRQTSSVRMDYVLTLRAKRQGILSIPPIRVDNELTLAIPIQSVPRSAAASRRMNQLVFFDTQVDTKNSYVQAQVLYTVKLFYAESISGDFPPPPTIEDAVIETIESERRYESIINNRRYFVLEKQYAIFPQKSGVLVIPRETFVGSRGQRSMFSRRERISAVSAKHVINVMRIPDSFTGDTWIPAKEFSLSEAWAEQPVFRVGEPVNRILSMSATGLAASLLPLFSNLKLDNAKTYADPPDTVEQAGPDGIIATNTTTIGIVPVSTGQLTLPEISIAWWNTETNKAQVAVIPAAAYTVLPAIGSVSVAPTLPLASARLESRNNAQPAGTPYWMWIAIALGIMWLFSTWQWRSVRSRLASLEDEFLSPEPTFETADENRAFKDLSKACKTSNPGDAHRLLFLWGSARFPHIESTHDLQKIANVGAFRKALAELELALYSPDEQVTWKGGELLQAVTVLRKTRETVVTRSALIGSLNPV